MKTAFDDEMAKQVGYVGASASNVYCPHGQYFTVHCDQCQQARCSGCGEAVTKAEAEESAEINPNATAVQCVACAQQTARQTCTCLGAGCESCKGRGYYGNP